MAANGAVAPHNTSTCHVRRKCVHGTSAAKALPAVGIQCLRRQRRIAQVVRRVVTEWCAGSSGKTLLPRPHIDVPCTQKMRAGRIYGKSAARRRHTMLAAVAAHITAKQRGAGSRGQRVLLPRAAFGEIGVLSHGCSAGFLQQRDFSPVPHPER